MNTSQNKTANISFEFFPPKTSAGLLHLHELQEKFELEQPQYYSVTYGAGGSTHQGTWNTVLEMHSKGLQIAPHLSCVGATKEQLTRLIFAYRAAGIKKIVALRGDLPSGTVYYGDCRYASDLVHLIRQTTGDWFDIKVAAYPEIHPQATSASKDIDYFVHKIEQGANSAITQYFYNFDAFIEFVNQIHKRGCYTPMVAGIMPIQNHVQLKRFSQMCGAEIPRWLDLRLQEFQDDLVSLREFGAEVVANLCEKLIEHGFHDLHFYTLNQYQPSIAILEHLKNKGVYKTPTEKVVEKIIGKSTIKSPTNFYEKSPIESPTIEQV